MPGAPGPPCRPGPTRLPKGSSATCPAMSSTPSSRPLMSRHSRLRLRPSPGPPQHRTRAISTRARGQARIAHQSTPPRRRRVLDPPAWLPARAAACARRQPGRGRGTRRDISAAIWRRLGRDGGRPPGHEARIPPGAGVERRAAARSEAKRWVRPARSRIHASTQRRSSR